MNMLKNLGLFFKLLYGTTLCVTISGCVAIVLSPIALVNAPFSAADFAMHGREGEYGCIQASFSNDSRYIGFILKDEAKRGKFQHLYVLSLDTNEIRQLTTGKRVDFELTFSPDSDSILFSSITMSPESSRKQAELNVIHIYGANPDLILTGKSIFQNPVFSCDGSKIAFSVDNKIHVMNADGSQYRLLSETDGGDAYPTFTQNGSEIVFWRAGYFGHASPIASSTWHDIDLYIASVDSGESRPLAETSHYWIENYYATPGASHLIWTDDDKRVLYARYGPSGGFDGPHEFAPKGPPFTYLWEGEEKQRLFHYSIISPDGATVLLGISTKPPEPRAFELFSPLELHVINIATGERKQLTQLGRRIIEAKFSPDGSKILFRVDPEPLKLRKTIELWVMNFDGSNVRQVVMDTET